MINSRSREARKHGASWSRERLTRENSQNCAQRDRKVSRLPGHIIVVRSTGYDQQHTGNKYLRGINHGISVRCTRKIGCCFSNSDIKNKIMWQK